VDFELSEEQRLLKDSVERLMERRYGIEARLEYLREPDGWSRELWSQFVELGLTGLPFAENDGGFGAGPVETMIVMEAFGRGLVVEPFLSGVILAGSVLRHAAPSAHVSSLMGALIDGSKHVALAHAESQARYDLADVATKALRQGDDGVDGWLIDGNKTLVLHGGSADALLVSARISGQQRDRDGIALFLVDAKATGLSRSDYALQDGTRAADVCFDKVIVANDAMIAAADRGSDLIDTAVDECIAAICAEAVGTMSAMHELTVEYIKTRSQFGVRIGSFQVLQHRAVDMLVALEQARSMALYAAMMANHADPVERHAAMAAAKIQIGRSGRTIAQQTIQLHGGMGMTREYAASYHVRRMLVLETLFGDAAHHLSTLAQSGGVYRSG